MEYFHICSERVFYPASFETKFPNMYSVFLEFAVKNLFILKKLKTLYLKDVFTVYLTEKINMQKQLSKTKMNRSKDRINNKKP